MKKHLHHFILLALFVFASAYSYSQTVTITLQPGAVDGKDAYISTIDPTTNFGNSIDVAAIDWTASSVPFTARSVFQFDLTSIPQGAVINYARLSLYGNPITGHVPGTSGQNESWLQRVTSTWNENTVTYNNQPAVTTQNRVGTAQLVGAFADYPNIDVTALVQDMVNDPANSFGFMLSLQNEALYRCLDFSSSDVPDAAKHPKLEINYNTGIEVCDTLYIQNSDDVYLTSYTPTTNEGYNQDIAAIDWTDGSAFTARSLFRFNLSSIPQSAVIDSAHLYLFGNPTSGHWQGSAGNNASWLQRVVTAWTFNTATWNMQPTATTANQVAVPQSTNNSQDYILDVKPLIIDMVQNPTTSFGFMLRLDDESLYHCMLFASSDHTNASLHPYLSLCYHTTDAIGEHEFENNFSVYPNPFSGEINITANVNGGKKFTVAIFNLLGELVYEHKDYPASNKINLRINSRDAGIAAGSYFVKISSDDNVSVKKIICIR